jgi:hypothetical protein
VTLVQLLGQFKFNYKPNGVFLAAATLILQQCFMKSLDKTGRECSEQLRQNDYKPARLANKLLASTKVLLHRQQYR